MEPLLVNQFLGFLDEGFAGVMLVRDGQWASYGWFSKPGSPGPQHLPWSVRHEAACWVFYCHTRESLRGRGCFGRLLSQLVAKVEREKLAPAIYIDTRLDNVASRRAILRLGFEPFGVMTTRQLWLPRIGSVVVSSSWQQQREHPALLDTRRGMSLTTT
jgi:RimJ/RimL family protein N-acetyltransferase